MLCTVRVAVPDFAVVKTSGSNQKSYSKQGVAITVMGGEGEINMYSSSFPRGGYSSTVVFSHFWECDW